MVHRGDSKQLFRDFLVNIGYPSNLISVEVAWMSQQPRGFLKSYMESITIIREYLDERRKREE